MKWGLLLLGVMIFIDIIRCSFNDFHEDLLLIIKEIKGGE